MVLIQNRILVTKKDGIHKLVTLKIRKITELNFRKHMEIETQKHQLRNYMGHHA